MTAPPAAACHPFEERLLLAMEPAADRGPLDLLPADPHPASCTACAGLVEALRVTDLLRTLSPPRPSERLQEALRAVPTDFALRREAAKTLALLEPGALARPEPPADLMGRLLFMPARARFASRGREAARRPAAVGFLARWKPLLGDWRFTVAAAYAATLILVTIYQIDPLSTARSAASDLTSAGERALADARSAAVSRLEDTALVRAAKPFTERLDYRVYRALTAGRARAAAYSQLFLERLFSGAIESSAEANPPKSEPNPPPVRS